MFRIKKIRNRYLKFRNRYFENFVFVHINKTGGTSIATALNSGIEHKTALQKKHELGSKKWSNSYTFTFVRNPWDKVVSHYHYRLQRGRLYTNQTEVEPIEFRDWVQLTYGSQDLRYYNRPQMFMPQSDWITADDGSVLVDFIGRFESLNEDFNRVCEKIGKKNIVLPHLKSSERGNNYRKYYDELTIDIVSKWFRKDIENFDYSF